MTVSPNQIIIIIFIINKVIVVRHMAKIAVDRAWQGGR